jgi:ferritin
MLNPKIQDAFNRQISAELSSAYLYLSMSAYFEAESLRGMAHWMRVQSQEEHKHAMKLFAFINERNGRVTLGPLEAPPSEWKSPLDVFEDAYKHELKVSGLINNLMNLALAEKDHAASSFLQWFVNEQVEEEAAAMAVRDELKLAGDHGVARLMMDRHLGQRAGG